MAQTPPSIHPPTLHSPKTTNCSEEGDLNTSGALNTKSVCPFFMVTRVTPGTATSPSLDMAAREGDREGGGMREIGMRRLST